MLFPINPLITICTLTPSPGGPFDLDFGCVSQLDDDLEDPQEELLAGGLAGQEGHGGQLQLPAGLDLFGGCHHNTGTGVIPVMYTSV